jgi:hypothetical protein
MILSLFAWMIESKALEDRMPASNCLAANELLISHPRRKEDLNLAKKESGGGGIKFGFRDRSPPAKMNFPLKASNNSEKVTPNPGKGLAASKFPPLRRFKEESMMEETVFLKAD